MAEYAAPLPRLGFIGLGNMGAPMVLRLLAAGHRVDVWNRDRSKAEPLVEAGATLRRSPADVAAHAELIGICLTDGHAVEAVVFGEDGIATCATPGHVIADFSTIAPDDARRLARQLREKSGAGWLDAPVSGGVPGAANGTLICFVGGEADVLAAATPLFAPLASKVTHMGPSGAGQTTKVCNQMIVAVNVLTIAETFGLASAAGVDVSRLSEALAGGFADSKPLQIFGPRMASGTFEPRQSAVQLMAKDVGLSQAIARQLAIDTPVAAFADALYQRIHADHPTLFDRDVSELVTLYRQGGSSR